MNDFNFSSRGEKIAEQFLLTALIVDDEARIQDLPGPTDSLKKPGRHKSAQTVDDANEADLPGSHSLDARTLVDSFAERGLICAVIAPQADSPSVTVATNAAKRADMVILDWQLNQDKGRETLKMLKLLLRDGEVERLRLIAVYTGEHNIRAIGETIRKELQMEGWEFKLDDRGVVLTNGNCRIVIYAKSKTPLASDLKNRSVSEAEVVRCLIGDFADLTKGLMPSIALTSLAAVRANAHKVLHNFSAELDPAFLAHRACLPSPDDSQQQMVSLLDSELHAIMDDATRKENPASIESVRDWLVSRFGQGEEFELTLGQKKLSFDQTVSLLQTGLDKNDFLNSKVFGSLSSGFAENGQNPENLDLRLAWMFNFRTVDNSPAPILQLGTAVLLHDEKNGENFFLCMRPRCDSMRLKQDAETFLLLPLIEPKKNKIQLVLKTKKDSYQRFCVCTNPSQWLLTNFNPSALGKPVIAEKSDDGRFFFTSREGEKFYWIGELKADFAQRVAQHFASGLSRVATDNSEWLRRFEQLTN